MSENSKLRQKTVRQRPRCGFTAMETLIATAVLAMVAAAVSEALSAGRQQARAAQEMVQGSMLARAMMDEIMRLPTTPPAQQSQSNALAGQPARASYDDIGDYGGYQDGPGGMQDLTGNLYPAELQSFRRDVAITSVSVTPTGWGKTLTGLQITVTVSKDERVIVTLQRVAMP